MKVCNECDEPLAKEDYTKDSLCEFCLETRYKCDHCDSMVPHVHKSTWTLATNICDKCWKELNRETDPTVNLCRMFQGA